MTVYEGGNINFVYLVDAEGIIPAGTQVDITFRYAIWSNNDTNPLRGDVPVFFWQINPDIAAAYAPPDPSLEFFESQHYTDLPDSPTETHTITHRVTVPTLSTAGNPALLIWFATNATTSDLVSTWNGNGAIVSLNMVRFKPPKLAIRGHSSGVRFA